MSEGSDKSDPLAELPTEEVERPLALYYLSPRQFWWLRLGVIVNGILVVAMLATLFYTVPRSVAYTRVVDENLAVKGKLQGLDDKMSEVERLLLRLRLYDAQLRSLSEPRGDHGPTDVESGWMAMDPAAMDIDFANVGPDGEPLEQFTPDDDGSMSGGLRSSDMWAAVVEDRADSFIDRMNRLEPNLTELVVELEEVRALDAALPKKWPSRGALTSGYGWRRDPVRPTGFRFHSGIDIANKHGTPIWAAAAGTVIRATYSSGYGRVIEVDHGYGIKTVYAHCRRLLVRTGDRVEEGQRIGLMGSSGKSTGPHLHYEVRLDGNAVDPMDYLPRGTEPPK